MFCFIPALLEKVVSASQVTSFQLGLFKCLRENTTACLKGFPWRGITSCSVRNISNCEKQSTCRKGRRIHSFRASVRLHCDVFSVPSCLLWLCSPVGGGGCWRCVLAAEVYRARSCTEGRGTGCGLWQAELSKKPYNSPQGSLGQQAGSAATLSASGKGSCLWSLLLPVPPQRDVVESRAHSKGSSSQRGPNHLGSLHRGEGQPRLSNASAGWSVTNSCRVTWLLGKEVLNFSHCPLG